MERGLVSVVLPIYNVEKYLEHCIESVAGQTYRNIEILLIDDGSPDGCPAICDRWAEKDSRIRVIHKKNEGLGMARNTGIENASGEYICFFDSDDYIAPDTIERVYSRAKETNADVVVFGISVLDADGNVRETFVPRVGDRVYDGDQVTEEFLPDYIAPDPRSRAPRLFYMSPCLLLYSLEMIKASGWRFVSEREIIAEDVYSQIALFAHVKRVASLSCAFYYYRANMASLSRSYRPDRYKKVRQFYLSAVELCEALGYSDEIRHRVTKPYLAFTIAAIKAEAASDRPRAERAARVREVIDDPVLREVLCHNRRDRVSLTRKILFFAMRARLYGLCMLLLRSRA